MTDLQSEIERFLAEPRQADYGWPPVEPQDLEQLNNIIYALIRAKWSPDVDGDYPIEFNLVDRTRYGGIPFLTVRYSHKAETDEERRNILLAHMANARIALQRLDIELSVEQRRDPERNDQWLDR